MAEFIKDKINILIMNSNQDIIPLSFVVDSNILISALVRDGVTRKIIFNPNLLFFTPDYTLLEIHKHKISIAEKAGIPLVVLDTLVDHIFSVVVIINKSEYCSFIDYAKILIGNVDIDDVSFLALSLSKDLPLWSNDQHFLLQNEISVYSTNYMMCLVDNLP